MAHPSLDGKPAVGPTIPEDLARRVTFGELLSGAQADLS